MGILSHHVPNLALTGKGERTHGAHKFQNLVKIAAFGRFFATLVQQHKPFLAKFGT